LRNLGVLWGFIVLSTGLLYFGGDGGNGPRPRRCVRVRVSNATRPCLVGCAMCARVPGLRLATTVDGPTQGTVERASSKARQRR
jgi:hypothetical protein